MDTTYNTSITQRQYLDAVFSQARTFYPRWMRVAGFFVVTAQYAAFGFLITVSMMSARTVPSKWIAAGAIAAAACTMLMWFLNRVGVSAGIRRSTHLAGRPSEVSVGDEGVTYRSAVASNHHPWGAIASVEERDGFVFLNLDNVHYYPIPFGTFASAEERQAFVESVRAKGLARELAAPTLETPSIPQPPLPASQSRWRLIPNAFRLAFFRDVAADTMEHGWGTIAAVAAIAALIPSIPAFWAGPFSGYWNWYALPSVAVDLALLLVSAAIAVLVTRRQSDVPRLLLAGLLAGIAIDVIFTIASHFLSTVPGYQNLRWSFAWFPPTWLALAFATYAARSIPRSVRRLALVGVGLACIAYPLSHIYRERSLWHVVTPEEAAAPRYGGIAAEDAFYKQPSVLANELESVRPGTPGVIDVFFVGMAGYGSQDVFMREVDSVARLFKERFGSEGHAVRLVNNRKTLLDTPIASKTSLRLALQRVAEVMDKDEDVLVLFLTSHGSDKHEFSLELWPMTFNKVDPATLRALLDESGIRNRVVIISACYSGGYVKPLEDPDTLIITAAAADKTSFGCTNEAEWTYFGKAYFDDALRKTFSFTAAFDAAKPAIERRETKDQFDHSEPQMSVGPSISTRLEALRAQLEQGSR